MAFGPSEWAGSATSFYYLTLVLCGLGVYAIRRVIFSPFGYAVRGCRDSVLRAESIGINRHSIQWLCFVIAGGFAGVAGVLYAYLKGSVFPDNLAIPTSIDGLVMVLMGGIQTVSGPIFGAGVYKGPGHFHDQRNRHVEADPWRDDHRPGSGVPGRHCRLLPQPFR